MPAEPVQPTDADVSKEVEVGTVTESSMSVEEAKAAVEDVEDVASVETESKDDAALDEAEVGKDEDGEDGDMMSAMPEMP